MKIPMILLKSFLLLILVGKVFASDNIEDSFQEFEQALMRAESVSAETHAPELLEKAQTSIADARLTQKERDREKAVQQAIRFLEQAYEKAKKPFSQSYITKLDALYNDLISSDLAKYAKKQFELVQKQIQQTKVAIEKDSLSDQTEFMFDRTLQNVENLVKTTQKNVETVRAFMQLVQERCDAMFAQNPHIQATFEKAKAALESGNLADTLTNLQNTMSQANKAAVTDEFLSKLKDVDDELFDIKNKLQRAGGFFIARPNGALEQPTSFDTNSYLQSHPLVDTPALPALFNNQHYSDVQLENYQIFSVDNTLPSMISVAAEVSTEDLYSQAVALWKDAVTLRNAGHLDEAVQYFQQAKNYLSAFRREAVSQVYTVQKRARNYDTLWKIAASKQVYGNADLWPLVWQRNKHIISNPDRLEPGQRLLIPVIE